MTPTTTLLEPSFVDFIDAIAQAPDLSEQRRRHWLCSSRQVGKWLDRPAAVIPARWQAVRFSVGQLHHARLGVTAKTLSNHQSNVKGALRWFSKEHDLPQYGPRLSPQWTRLLDGVEKPIRQRLYNFSRYCSARGIGASEVDDGVFGRYWDFRARNPQWHETLCGSSLELRG
jgi:hypothetical protein